MHNPRHTKPNKLLFGLGLLLCLLLSLGSGQVLADGNITCSGPGTGGTAELIDLGNLQPGEQFKRDISANCYTLKIFPYGVSIGQFQSSTQGSLTEVTVVHKGSNKIIPLLEPGAAGTVCLPTTCTRLIAHTDISYSVTVEGKARSDYGSYYVMLYLNYTMHGAVANNGTLQKVTFKYTVGQPSCTLLSDSILALSFGTLDSNEIASSQQIADVVLDCPSYSSVTATLLSSAQGITGAAGVSKTSLPELLMATTWADTNTPVNFDTPRTFVLYPGVNAIRVGFRPRLLTANSKPTGKFQTQYTLNISYR